MHSLGIEEKTLFQVSEDLDLDPGSVSNQLHDPAWIISFLKKFSNTYFLRALGDINEIKYVKALYIKYKMLSKGKVVLFGALRNQVF